MVPTGQAGRQLAQADFSVLKRGQAHVALGAPAEAPKVSVRNAPTNRGVPAVLMA